MQIIIRSFCRSKLKPSLRITRRNENDNSIYLDVGEKVRGVFAHRIPCKTTQEWVKWRETRSEKKRNTILPKTKWKRVNEFSTLIYCLDGEFYDATITLALAERVLKLWQLYTRRNEFIGWFWFQVLFMNTHTSWVVCWINLSENRCEVGKS